MTESDAAIYFGRDSDIIRGLDNLRAIREKAVEQILVIIGASGSGKSSFLKAGLWPRLKRDARNYFPLPGIRPGNAVINGREDGEGSLVTALSTSLKMLSIPHNRAEIADELKKESGLYDVLVRIREEKHKSLGNEGVPVTLLLGIDQAEELFNPEGKDEASHFLELIRNTIETDKDKGKSPPLLTVIPTIRSDRYGQLQEALKQQGLSPALFDLPPVSRSGYKDIIEGPAKIASKPGSKLEIDPKLVERLLEDSTGTDALPLLAYTLHRLYQDFGGDGKLELSEYKGMQDTIEAAVSKACMESGFSQDKKVQNETLISIFIPALASINPDSDEPRRNIAGFDELTRSFPAYVPLIKQLVEQRLLVRNNDALEIAHESVLRQWPLLKDALGQEKDNLRVLDGVKAAAHEWDAKNRQEIWLTHQGVRLESALQLQFAPAYRNELEKRLHAEYLAASSDRQMQTKSEKEQSLVLINKVIMADAERALENHDSVRALRLALIATRSNGIISPDPDLEAALSSIVHHNAHRVTLRHDEIIFHAAFSADGQRVVTASVDGTARIWNTVSGKRLAELQHDGEVNHAVFSADGQRVVTASRDKTARTYDIHRLSAQFWENRTQRICQRYLKGQERLDEKDMQASTTLRLRYRVGDSVCESR